MMTMTMTMVMMMMMMMSRKTGKKTGKKREKGPAGLAEERWQALAQEQGPVRLAHREAARGPATPAQEQQMAEHPPTPSRQGGLPDWRIPVGPSPISKQLSTKGDDL